MIKKNYHKMTITLDNVNQAQAIALTKMFKYMEYLGNTGSSRMCCFYSDGDGDFRPKVTIDYPEDLPEVSKIDGIITREDIKNARKNNEEIININKGDFIIDFDSISWEIYH
jgi:hypothetical protein